MDAISSFPIKNPPRKKNFFFRILIIILLIALLTPGLYYFGIVKHWQLSQDSILALPTSTQPNPNDTNDRLTYAFQHILQPQYLPIKNIDYVDMSSKKSGTYFFQWAKKNSTISFQSMMTYGSSSSYPSEMVLHFNVPYPAGGKLSNGLTAILLNNYFATNFSDNQISCRATGVLTVCEHFTNSLFGKTGYGIMIHPLPRNSLALAFYCSVPANKNITSCLDE